MASPSLGSNRRNEYRRYDRHYDDLLPFAMVAAREKFRRGIRYHRISYLELLDVVESDASVLHRSWLRAVRMETCKSEFLV